MMPFRSTLNYEDEILNPGKLVLLPDLNAGCSLADRCPPDAFRAFKEKHPDAFVVSYVNCSAAVKALSDVICTSSNAEKIVSRVPRERQIIFAPDQHRSEEHTSELQSLAY